MVLNSKLIELVIGGPVPLRLQQRWAAISSAERRSLWQPSHSPPPGTGQIDWLWMRLSHQFARLFLPSLLTFFHKKNKKCPAEKLHWTPAQKLNETPVQAPVNATPKRKYQCVELIHLLTQIQKCGRAGEKSKKASQLAKHMAMPLWSSLDPHLILEIWQQWFDFSFA